MQTRRRFTPPFTTAFTRWMLALNRRRVTLCAWLTFRPNAGPFPQMSQRLAMVTNWSLLTGASKPAPRRVRTTNYTRGPTIAGFDSFYGTTIRGSSESRPSPGTALSDAAVLPGTGCISLATRSR